MSEPTGPQAARPHLQVSGRAANRDFSRSGGGDARIRDVERRAHGEHLRGDLSTAIEDADDARAANDDELTLEELRAIGVIVVLEAASDDFPLKLDSLERMSLHRKTPRRPQWLLLSVSPPTDTQPEQAVVWISDEYRANFLRLFEDFLELDTQGGNPRNRELVANIATIRTAIVEDLWQSADPPTTQGTRWWELWLVRTDGGPSLLEQYASALQLTLSDRRLDFGDRSVMWLEASWDDLQGLPFTSIPLAEIRFPEIVDTVEDFAGVDQDALGTDLEQRTSTAGPDAPSVCHLDTGVRASHILLTKSIAENDVHSVVDEFGADLRGHGTRMAGLALYGDQLDSLLLGSGEVSLFHRLESVKILPDVLIHDPLTYGLVTAQATAAVETAAPTRKRVFCMPVTAPPEGRPGDPSLWSASVDALSFGTDIAQSDDGIALVGDPDSASSRLYVISAGNVRDHQSGLHYRDLSDLSGVEDPAHAWNALTVGAHTMMDDVPTDPTYIGWEPVGTPGDISPHTRTSISFSHRSWPIKPDICMEGGNVLSDGSDFDPDHPLLSLRTTGAEDDTAIRSANATSASTAQAARLACLAQVQYPDFWPETIRGLLTHSAEWTDLMRAEVDGATTKASRQTMLRRYGWGVPTQDRVLASTGSAVTLVTQDAFVPFEGPEHRARHFRLHMLPWPGDVLNQLATEPIELRVTLSYFIEPNASRRGWRRRYAYQSHALRFELQGPLESVANFTDRINRAAQEEEQGGRPSSGTDHWLVGANQRSLGSLHQDIWSGSGAELASCRHLAVHPVGGWWKNARRADRADRPVRYSLLMSLRTPRSDVDLYSAIEAEIPVSVPNEVVIES